MSPALAAICNDLGLGDRIVGRNAYDIVLDPAIPVAGDINGFDYERLIRLNPTHILLERSAKNPPDRLLRLAKERGWAIEVFPLLTLDDIPNAAGRLAQEFDNPQVRGRLSAMLTDLDASLQPAGPGARNAGRLLALYWTNPVGAAGPGSFHYEILVRMGFEPALTEGGPYVTLDPEDVLRIDPESLLLIMPGADAGRIEELLGPLARLDLRCVRDGRVGVITDELANLPATTIGRMVREIREITDPWPPAGVERTAGVDPD